LPSVVAQAVIISSHLSRDQGKHDLMAKRRTWGQGWRSYRRPHVYGDSTALVQVHNGHHGYSLPQLRPRAAVPGLTDTRVADIHT
jgi:hypothetical protein